MFKCNKCFQEKDDSHKKRYWDNRLNSYRFYSYCKSCIIKRTNEKKRSAGRMFILDYLETHPCEFCGEKDPRCLDFDHLDQSTKFLKVSKLIGRYSVNKIKDEVKKTRVLCANCHKIHTVKQLNQYKDLPQFLVNNWINIYEDFIIKACVK